MTSANAIAIIPARGGSRRLPRKNILPMHGRPMLGWPVRAALDSGIFSHVIVSTEDVEIAEIGAAQGARIIMRPAELATDSAHEFAAYSHVLDTLQAEGVSPEFFCGLYATAVLLLPEDLREAYEKISSKDVDVVMGVSAYNIHPYKALEQSDDSFLRMVHPVECRQQSQTYPHYVASNGTFYFMRTNSYRAEKTYYPEKLLGYEIPASRTVDLDTEEDYVTAKALMEVFLARKDSHLSR